MDQSGELGINAVGRCGSVGAAVLFGGFLYLSYCVWLSEEMETGSVVWFSPCWGFPPSFMFRHAQIKPYVYMLTTYSVVDDGVLYTICTSAPGRHGNVHIIGIRTGAHAQACVVERGVGNSLELISIGDIVGLNV